MISITSITKATTLESMLNSVVQDQPKYYVDILIESIIINLESIFLIKKSVKTLEQFLVNVRIECKIPKTQEALAGINLLSLPHLLARKTSGREPLVDYSQSHVVTSEMYLTTMQQKAMDREVA